MDKSSSIRGAIVIVISIIVAIWLGVNIVTDQTLAVLYILGSSLFLTCVFLGRKIWLLYVLFSTLNFQLIRGLGTVEVGQVLFIGFTFVIFLMRRQPLQIKFGELEILMLLLACCVIQVYLRNPVGLNIFGSGSVGGRPYFIVLLAFLTGSLLGNIVVPPHEIKWALKLSILGSLLGLCLSAIQSLRGGEISKIDRKSGLEDRNESGRIGILGGIGTSLAQIISTFVSPFRACFNPLWGPLILISIGAAAGSGYRNNVAYLGMVYLVAIAYRNGFAAVLISLMSAIVGLGILAVVNIASPLPPNIQRALSPFPGTWEDRYIKDAEESTEWRVQMWKEALFTDYWIHNKILGDGLGFTKKEYELMMSTLEGGSGLQSTGSGMNLQQESMMISGGYHSGPVQTVRVVGYVGLIILIIALARNAVHAHRQIIRCRRTEWYSLALYFGIPVIIQPFMFIFIVGDFGRDASTVFISYGILRLLEKNLPLPTYSKHRQNLYKLNTRDSKRLS
jgi:hypothetical protein